MLDLYGGAPVNNAGIDPIQGFDIECWVQESFSGSKAFFGRFQSITLSVRDATETYLELGQRVPIYLNGEIQIAWVLEQGLIDMAFIARTFGIKNIRRDQIISRGPRFHISFDANALGRDSQTSSSGSETEASTTAPGGPTLVGGTNPRFGGVGEIYTTSGDLGNAPMSKGRYELMRCKVDSVSLGIMPGRRVSAVRWEGVSEGISFDPESKQEAPKSDTTQGD